MANGALLTNLLLAVNPKLAPVYLFALAAVLLLLRKRYSAAALALAVLPLVSVAVAPAVGLGLLGLAAYLWRRQHWPWARAAALLLPLAAAGLYLGLFYALQPEPYQFPATGRAFLLGAAMPEAGELRLLFNIAVGVVLNYCLYYLGYGVLLAGLFWRAGRPLLQPADRPVLALFAATLLGAVLARSFGHNFMDGFQFFSNCVVPFTAVVVALLLGRVLQGAPRSRVVLAAGVLLALLQFNVHPNLANTTSYSSEFLQKVGPVLRRLPDRGGYVFADKDYKNAYMMSADSYTAGNYVANFKNNYSLLSLSAFVPDSLGTDPRYARDSAQAEQIRRKTTLYRLAKFSRLAGRPLPADSLPLVLVRRARLAFVCASRQAALPACLRPLVRASYRDARSGETLYVLR